MMRNFGGPAGRRGTQGVELPSVQLYLSGFLVDCDEGDCWVVRPDGTLRDPDIQNAGCKSWNIVERGELALKWFCVGDQRRYIAKVPRRDKTPLTLAQFCTVSQIQEQISGSGAFNLPNRVSEKEITSAQDMSCRALDRSEILIVKPKLRSLVRNGLQIFSRSGLLVNEKHIKGSIGDRANPDNFIERCANRDAQSIERLPAGVGVLELLAYQKWGRWNLNLRWRPRREGETVAKKPKQPSRGNPTTIAGLANRLAERGFKTSKLR